MQAVQASGRNGRSVWKARKVPHVRQTDGQNPTTSLPFWEQDNLSFLLVLPVSLGCRMCAYILNWNSAELWGFAQDLCTLQAPVQLQSFVESLRSQGQNPIQKQPSRIHIHPFLPTLWDSVSLPSSINKAELCFRYTLTKKTYLPIIT